MYVIGAWSCLLANLWESHVSFISVGMHTCQISSCERGIHECLAGLQQIFSCIRVWYEVLSNCCMARMVKDHRDLYEEITISDPAY